MSRTAVVTAPIDAASLIARVTSNEHGAVSLFLGTVRERNDSRAVTGIEYSVYQSMAEDELERIASEACDRFDGASLAIEHRIGVLALGDVSVAIAVAHEHRSPALDCTRYVIEEIKKRVPIWKREHYADGTREWVDPTREKTAVTV